jgi:ABC-2 type transport system permease protein
VTPFIILAAAAVFVAIRLTLRHRSGRTRPGASSSESLETPRRSLLASVFGDIGLVAHREVHERIRGRVFQVGTTIILLVVVAAIVVPTLNRSKAQPDRVGVVGGMSAPVKSALVASDSSIGDTMALVPEPNVAAADADLRAGRVDIVIVDGKELVVKEAISANDVSSAAQLSRVFATTLGTIAAFQAAGLSAAQVDTLSHAQPLPVTSLQASTTRRNPSPGSVVSLILVFVMLTQYSTWILTGVAEEKSSRVVEVLLAALRPAQLLAGKVLGIGLVALTQATLIVGVALGVSSAVGSNLLHGSGPMTVLAALVWLILGYGFYCWLYAAAGSTVERQEQIQSLAFPLSIPLIVGYVVSLITATTGKPSTFLEVLAYLPPTAPFAMPTLVSLGSATWWQFAISVALSIASTIAVARLATSIYRRAILRTGRRVRIRELISVRRAGPRDQDGRGFATGADRRSQH